MRQGQKKDRSALEDLDRSRGGWISKIHCAPNGSGQALSPYLSGGEVHDSKYGLQLLELKRAKYILGYRAYSGKKVLEEIASMGAEAVIPPHQRSRDQRSYNAVVYKERNQIERFLNRLKHFRGIVTRYCKRGAYFLEAVKFAACIITLIN